ncbi:MAG: hypothetical protein WBL15_09365 [Phycisphaerae bacterium]
MKRTAFLFAVLGPLLGIATVYADVPVRGYYRNDGTYVQPHMRSNPDGNPFNNYSTYPNVNPYTGVQGTKHFPRYPSAGSRTGGSSGGSSGDGGRGLAMLAAAVGVGIWLSSSSKSPEQK